MRDARASDRPETVSPGGAARGASTAGCTSDDATLRPAGGRRGSPAGATHRAGFERRGRPWRGWLLVGVVVVGWEVSRTVFDVSPLLMPSVVTIVGEMVRGVVAGDLLTQLGRSLVVIVVGAGVAVLAAMAAVPLATGNRWADEFLQVAGSLLHPLPGIALLPLIVLWFGVGTAAVTVVIVHSVFWPVVTNLQAGYRGLPETWNLLAANYRLTGLRFVLRIALPGTFPYLLAGLRIAWARSWRALISAEMVFGALAGGGGVGWYVYTRRVYMDAPGLFAGILLVMIVGSAVESVLFRAVEDRTVRRWGMST